mgnify:CR=1 FL=1
MKITFVKSDTKDTERYVKLYRKCFHKYPIKKNSVYFNWLYNQNPLGKFIGIDAFEGETLIGQVGGIPQEFNYMDKKIKILNGINVCVDPNYRGKNLFSEMANRLTEYAKDQGFSYIIAIANKPATYTWKKSINMEYISSLDVLFGYGNLNLPKFSAKNDYFFQIWNQERIRWRINNPYNKINIYNKYSKIKLKSSSVFSFIETFAYLDNKNYQLDFDSEKINIFPKLFLGLIPNICKKKFINIPNFIKPSPLNFLIKDLNKDTSKIEKNECFISYLDFDAY